MLKLNKKCSKCGEIKDASEYPPRKDTKSGIRSWCSVCESKRMKEYNDNNKDKISQLKKDWLKNNREARVNYRKVYYEKNRESSIEKSIKWAKENPERNSIKLKKWYLENKERHIAKNKEWKINNAEKSKNYYREYTNERRQNDIEFKIKAILRARLNKVLKSKSIEKTQSAIVLVGCNCIELQKHIESKFDDKMTWANYGKYGWHIDHIKPCASFDLKDINQQKECFHYSNLQPLWATDNHRKGSRIIQ